MLGVLAVGFAAVTWLVAPTAEQLADEWILTEGSLFGRPIDQIGYTPIAFSAFDGQIGGHDGCNWFTTTGGITAGWLWTNPFGEHIGTLAGCPDGPIGDAADRYRSAVTRWARWARITPSDELVLWGPATTLRFAPRQPGVNVDQWWTLVSATAGGDTFTAGPDTAVPEIWLHVPLDDAMPIEGFNGCNFWTAPHDALTIDGAVSLGDLLEATDGDCAEIAGAENVPTIAPVDELVFEALGQVNAAALVDGHLVLTGPDAELVYELGR